MENTIEHSCEIPGLGGWCDQPLKGQCAANNEGQGCPHAINHLKAYGKSLAKDDFCLFPRGPIAISNDDGKLLLRVSGTRVQSVDRGKISL